MLLRISDKVYRYALYGNHGICKSDCAVICRFLSESNRSPFRGAETGLGKLAQPAFVPRDKVTRGCTLRNTTLQTTKNHTKARVEHKEKCYACYPERHTETM